VEDEINLRRGAWVGRGQESGDWREPFNSISDSAVTERTLLARPSTAARKLPLDISPAIKSGGVTITVIFENKPLAKTVVWIWAPDGKETKLTTDADGTITLKSLAPGVYSFAAIQ
jgi:hypothetical protein